MEQEADPTLHLFQNNKVVDQKAALHLERTVFLNVLWRQLSLQNANLIHLSKRYNNITLLLFFLLFEIELVPLYFLISIWGGPKCEYAATKFLLYTALSGALILAGALGMVWLSEAGNFNYDTLANIDLSASSQVLLLLPILFGFGIKIPLIPLHTWLPDAYVEASTPVAI
ncbi:MAG: proton-conducting transporter membrane subunit, partial [Cyanobacteria bacterium J06641_2]